MVSARSRSGSGWAATLRSIVPRRLVTSSNDATILDDDAAHEGHVIRESTKAALHRVRRSGVAKTPSAGVKGPMLWSALSAKSDEAC